MASVAMSPDDKFLAAGGQDGNVYLWNLANGKPIKTIAGSKDSVAALTFGNKAGTLRLAVAYRSSSKEPGGDIKAWDLETGANDAVTAKEVCTLPVANRTLECLAFTPDGGNIVWGGSAGSVELWDDGGHKVKEFAGPKKTINCLALSRDGRILTVGSGEDSVHAWEVASGKSCRTRPGKPPARSPA